MNTLCFLEQPEVGFAGPAGDPMSAADSAILRAGILRGKPSGGPDLGVAQNGETLIHDRSCQRSISRQGVVRREDRRLHEVYPFGL